MERIETSNSGLSVRPCSMMRRSWPSTVNVSAHRAQVEPTWCHCPGKSRRANCSTEGEERHLHGLQHRWRCYRPSGWETVEQNAQTVEVVEMSVRYLDGLQVAVVESDPISESLGLSLCPRASTSTTSYSPKTKVDVIRSKPRASPKGIGRSPSMLFPRAVKTFALSVIDATGATARVVYFSPFVRSIWRSLLCQCE